MQRLESVTGLIYIQRSCFCCVYYSILWKTKYLLHLYPGFVGVSYLTSKENCLSSSVTSPMHFTFRPCRPFCLFTWELWPTLSPSVGCWAMLLTTCRSDTEMNLFTVCTLLAIYALNDSLTFPLYLQGVLESFLGTAISGGVFCLLAGQPLTILSSTGPVLVFERLLFNFSRSVCQRPICK